MVQPLHFAWLVAGQLAVAERPGGGGRSHRAVRRDAELAWWRAQGVALVVSGMRTRHGLLETALTGMQVRWHPLADLEQGPHELLGLVATVAAWLADGRGPVLVHVDRPGEWCAAVDAALRLRLGLAPDQGEALAQAGADGFTVGDVAAALIGRIAADLGPSAGTSRAA